MAYASDLSAAFPEIWLPEMQKLRDFYTVAPKIASFFSDAAIKYGDKFHNPYENRVILETFTKGTDLSAQAYTITNEDFTIDQRKAVRVQMSRQDKKQSMYNLNASLARRYQASANKHIDSIVLGEYANAGDDIYNDDIGGAGATTSCALNSGNVSRIFTAADKKLHNLTRGQMTSEKIAVISPAAYEYLQLYFGGRETPAGDALYKSGASLNAFGYQIYVSNLLTWTGTWTPTDNPSNNDTIAINGVTITFKTTLSGGDDEVKIGAATADTLDNLVALINDPLNRLSSANYAAFTLANAELLEGCVATDGTTNATFIFKGCSDCVVASSADTWSAQVTHGLIGLKGFTSFALQLLPNTAWKEEPYQPSGEGSFIMDFFYGYKTWVEGAKNFLDVNINASSLN